MAEVLLRDAVVQAHLQDRVRVTSCGMGGWHVGQAPDSRALAELRRAGHDGSDLRASQLSPDDLSADLIVALDTGHRAELIARGAEPERIRLLRDFDPHSPEQSSVADPYYGGAEGFATTRGQIESALPGLLEWVRSGLQ